MDYLKLFENIDYNNLVTSYNDYVASNKKFRKLLNDLEPLTIFIYKTIIKNYGEEYNEHDIEGNIEKLKKHEWDNLSLDNITSVDDRGIIIYYNFEIVHRYGDSDNMTYYLELSKEQFKHYEERFEIEKETKKYNI